MLRGKETLTADHYYRYSMEWLRASDAVWMISGWEISRGALAEKAEAEKLNIPVFYDLDHVKKYFGGIR
jgi:hypothetical protein